MIETGGVFSTTIGEVCCKCYMSDSERGIGDHLPPDNVGYTPDRNMKRFLYLRKPIYYLSISSHETV